MNLEALPTFDVSAIPSFYAAPAAIATDAAAGLADDRRLTRLLAKRTLLDFTRVANAAKHLNRLPDRDESMHCVMRGNYNAWDLVPAVLRLADQTRCEELLIATLGFNARNAAELIELLDAGQVGRVLFLCSCYFKGSCAEEFNLLANGLNRRGQQIKAARNHAKVIALKLGDGRCIVIEGSANLRSCQNVEQFTATESPELYAFHRAWVEELLKQPEPPTRPADAERPFTGQPDPGGRR